MAASRRRLPRLLCLLLSVVTYTTLVSSQFLRVPEACTGFSCENQGTLRADADGCWCYCPATHTGLQCETELETSEWPDGAYATPMPIYGCPEEAGRGWRTGYINVTFVTSCSGSRGAARGARLQLLGPYSDRALQMNFCYKLPGRDRSPPSTVAWPPGDYRIYRAGSTCPTGFEEGEIRLELPPILHHNVDGHLPDLRLTEGATNTVLQLATCQSRQQASEHVPLSPWQFPYILLPGTISQNTVVRCPRFANMEVLHETLPLPNARVVVLGGGTTAARGASFQYCSYKRDFKQGDDILEPWQSDFSELLRYQFAAVRKSLASAPYRELYTNYPVTQGGKHRKAFFEGENCGSRPRLDCAEVPLAVFLESRNVPWVLVDLEQTFHVTLVKLQLISLDDLAGVVGSYQEVPGVGVSAARWAFLHNGALTCDVNLRLSRTTDMVYQQCSRPVPGRYVSLYGTSYAVAPEKVASFFMRLSDVKVAGTGRGCGKDLGMRDLGIEDFQISASTSAPGKAARWARPRSTGWCAAPSDPAPYWQVDLLVATPIEGIKVYNWAVTEGAHRQNVYGVHTSPTGVQAFWLQYGVDAHSLHTYSTPRGRKIFQLDQSLPYHHEQTVILHTTIVASLLRVRPNGFQHDHSLAPCLRLELIGCRRLKLKTLQCSDEKPSFWTRRPTVFVSHESVVNTESLVVDSYTDCIRACPSCVAVTYNTKTDSCSVYNNTDTYRYRRVSSGDSDVTHFQKVCIAGATAVPPLRLQFVAMFAADLFLLGFSERRVNKENFPPALVNTVHREGVLTSYGYPFRYDTGVITKWHVRVTFHCQLIFTNISLNIYQAGRDWYSEEVCEDKIIVWNLFVANRTFVYTARDLAGSSNRFAVVNNTMNGKQVIYTSETNEIEMNFYACLRESRVLYSGQGVRAIVKANDNRIRVTADKPRSGPSFFAINRGFHDIPSFLVSNALTGLGDTRSRFEYFVVQQIDTTNINLTIIDMFVYCDEYLGLTVEDMGFRLYRFCNLNRPMTSIILVTAEIRIRLTNDLDFHRLQGFKAVYHWIQPCGECHLETNVSVSRHGHRDWMEVCIARFGKCYGFRKYHFFEPTVDAVSAHEANKLCSQTMGPSAMLAGIRSRYEVTYLYQNLLRYTWSPFIWRGATHMQLHYDFIYIGLEWYTDVDGVLKPRWKDGSQLSYTAWSRDEPSGAAGQRCTRMSMVSQAEVESWQSVDCDDAVATFYLCERSMGHGAATDVETFHHQLSSSDRDLVHVDSVKYLQCQSRELVSRLSICDGIQDCLDGSDELHCDKGGVRAEWFTCANGDTVPVSATCDFLADCVDSSDEDCVFPDCTNDEFQCGTGQCIPQEQVCDVRPDCWDGSDERHCTTCGGGTFQCSDHSCLPAARRCDGFRDCQDALDEDQCERLTRSSCTDWWREGNSQSGVFLVNSTRVLCNFDLILSLGVIETQYHNMQVEMTAAGQFAVTYENLGFVENLMSTLVCNQSLIQSCGPLAEVIDDIEDQVVPGGVRSCLCLRLIWTADSSLVESCTPDSDSSADNAWLLEKARHFRPDGSRPVTLVKPVPTAFGSPRMKVEPIICHERVTAVRDKLLCARGNAVSAEHKCLYELDSHGDITGCRDLTHLQNCEAFPCPAGFIKCPDSFCLASSLLCDGESQCPDGRDEISCWCGPQAAMLAVLYDADAGLERAALRLASQLYNHSQSALSSNVLLVRHNQSTDDGFEDSDWESAHFGWEHTFYLPRKVDQFSEKDAVVVAGGRPLMASLLEEVGARPSALVLLLNTASRAQFLTADRQQLNSSSLAHIDLFAVYIGSISDPTYSRYRDALPVSTTHVHFRMDTVVEPLPLGPRYCPVVPASRAPVCPGMYRCHGSRQCVAMSRLCDGVRDCPLGDDEKLCPAACPGTCSCSAYQVDCSRHRATEQSIARLGARTAYLDLHSNDFRSVSFQASNLLFVVTLNMSHCLLNSVPSLFLKSMRNLLTLDLSFNQISVLRSTDLTKKFRLINLDLTGNYRLYNIEPMSFCDVTSLRRIACKGCKINTIVAKTFQNINVTHLDLSGGQISTVEDYAFEGSTVNSLDITKNRISVFSKDMFSGMSGLKTLKTDAYKFCCMRPSSVQEADCYPPRDEFSSCADLMRKEELRFLLWIIGVGALLGNIVSLLYRFKFEEKPMSFSYGIFVTNLSVADFLMGVYLLIIAVADSRFRGRYTRLDAWWRGSGWCGLAGVLSTTACEASVFFICLITLDRYVVIKYPFGRFRFTPRLAHCASAAVWVVVLNMATVPLWFTAYFQGKFYSRSPVCLALPLTRDKPPGWAYSTAVYIGLNFLVFVAIAIGQLLIYWEVLTSSGKLKKARSRNKDGKVARKLLLVAATDFLCWAPIGVIGFMALNGHVVSSDAYAWATVLILPVNSALNPFLYTFSSIMNRKKLSKAGQDEKTPLYCKAELDTVLAFWDSEVLCQKLGDKRDYTGLREHLSGRRLTPSEILRVGLRLSGALRQLHAVNLVHGELSLQLVSVRRHRELVYDATLRIEPRLTSRGAETRRDLEGLGQILSELLVNLVSRK